MRSELRDWRRWVSGERLFACRTRSVFPARPAVCLLAWTAFLVGPALGEDYFWNAGQPYNEGPWVGCDYLLGFPDRPCGYDFEGYPLYERANCWQRTCCGCTLLPYPHGPSDRAFLGYNYNVHLYRDCGYPTCDVSIAALNLGWRGYLSVYADLAVATPLIIPASCMLSLNGGCNLTAMMLNQGEIDNYMGLDDVITFTGSIENTGRMFISGTWANGGGAGALMNSGSGFIDSEFFDTDLAITNAGELWSMAYDITLRSSFTQTAGTLLVNGSRYDTTVTNHHPLNIQGGMICGEGPITGRVNNTGGILAPGFPEGWWFGASVGQMLVGSLTQGSDATLQVRLLQGDWDILYPTQNADQVKATGLATLAGTLNVIHGAPQLAGERYIVVSAAGISGEFDRITGPGSYVLTYEPTRVILTVIDPGGDQTPPTVAVTSPTIYSEYTTSLATVDLAGTAADDVAVAAVGWSSGTLSGSCAGTMDWSAAGIPIQLGRNVITITAQDAAGNKGISRLAITRICPPWDLDGDGHVDGNDMERFQACASGPAISAVAGCRDADFDNDGDVDQDDFGIFQRCYSGADRPADPNCAN